MTPSGPITNPKILWSRGKHRYIKTNVFKFIHLFRCVNTCTRFKLKVIHLDRCSWDISSLTLNPGYMPKSTKHLCAIILIFQITVKTWMEYQYTILFHFGHPCLRVQNKNYNKYQILILTVIIHISNSYMYPSWGVRREKCIQKLTRAYT